MRATAANQRQSLAERLIQMHKPKPEMPDPDAFYEKYVPDPPPLDWDRAGHIVYEGIRKDGDELNTSTGVLVDGVPDVLPWRLDLYNHSPTGLEWGYGGSGPHQLAVAILAHATGDDATAKAKHWAFTADVTCQLPRNGWTLTGTYVLLWVEAHPLSKHERFEHLPKKLKSELMDQSIAEDFLSECCNVDMRYLVRYSGGNRRSFAVCTKCNAEYEF